MNKPKLNRELRNTGMGLYLTEVVLKSIVKDEPVNKYYQNNQVENKFLNFKTPKGQTIKEIMKRLILYSFVHFKTKITQAE